MKIKRIHGVYQDIVLKYCSTDGKFVGKTFLGDFETAKSSSL
jgi:hypothetical protein